MANTTNTKTTNTKTTTESKATKELKAQIKSQNEQIEMLMKMVQELKNNSTPDIALTNSDLAQDEEVLVISLTPNKLNLLGRDGTVLFSFDNMYEEQYIDYASLKEIVTANRHMARNGRFYIVDERVVNKLRLKNDYKSILSPEQLKNILLGNVSTAVELYKMAPKGQKSVIVDLVKDKKFNQGGVDYNLLKEIGELSGVDLVNIEDATKIEISK